MQPNCVYFCLLPTRAAAGQRPCLRRGRMIASSDYCKQLNHHKRGLALLSESEIKNWGDMVSIMNVMVGKCHYTD